MSSYKVPGINSIISSSSSLSSTKVPGIDVDNPSPFISPSSAPTSNEFHSRHQMTMKMSLTPMTLSHNNVKNNYQSIVAKDFDVDSDTVIEFTIVHHRCALYLYVVPILYYDIQYFIGLYSINTTICDDGKRIDSNYDHDLVHYGVVYAYVHHIT